MKCPLCQFDDSKVVDSRNKSGRRVRRRLCNQCQQHFSTTEIVGIVKGDLPLLALHIEKKNGKVVEFSRTKLLQSISVAVRKSRRDDVPIEQIVDNIEQELHNSVDSVIKTTVIGQRVMAALYQYDRWAYIRYLSVHQQMDNVEQIKAMIKELKELLPADQSDSSDHNP